MINCLLSVDDFEWSQHICAINSRDKQFKIILRVKKVRREAKDYLSDHSFIQ